MKIWAHVIVSSIVTILLLPYFGVWALLALVGGVLIDGDHIIWHIARKKSWNLIKAYHYSRSICKKKDEDEYFISVLIGHSYEFFLLSLLIAFSFNPFFPFVFGLIIHLIMDFIQTYNSFKQPHFLVLFEKSVLVFFKNWLSDKDYYKDL